jgi:serine protease Do
VHDVNALRNRIAETKPGSAAQLDIVRSGTSQHVTATLEALDAGKLASNGDGAGEGSDADHAALGVTVAPLTPELASRLHVPDGTKGLVVRDVDPDGRAADADIRSGDVIEQVNRQPVTSVDELREALRKTGDRPALLLIARQGNEAFVTVRPHNG